MANLRGKVIYIVGAALAVVQFAIIGGELGWLPISTSQLTPVLGSLLVIETLIALIIWIESEAAAQAQADSLARKRLIERVGQEWIKGVLQPALDETQVNLTLRRKAECLGMREGPLQKQNDPDYRLDATIARHFVDMKRKLVIIGAPGSGKTIMLLQLMNALLAQAQERDSKPIPVLFYLASWGIEHSDFEPWLAAELERNYGLGAELARQWLGGQRLTYLLDGLDEVAPDRRDACIAAINRFSTRKRSIAITCGSEAYAEASMKLDIKKVVEIMPLDEPATRAALEREFDVDKADAILAAAKSTREPCPEFYTPLMIHAVVEAYENDDFTLQPAPDESPALTLRRVGIEPFLRKRLQEQSAEVAPDDARRYLAWMAHNLQRRGQRVFYVERLHDDWLPRRLANAGGSRWRIVKKRFDLCWHLEASWRQLLRGALKGLRPFLLLVLPLLLVGFVGLSSLPQDIFTAAIEQTEDLGEDASQLRLSASAISALLQRAFIALGALALLLLTLRYAFREAFKGTDISQHSAIGGGLGATFKHSMARALAGVALVAFATLLPFWIADSLGAESEFLSFNLDAETAVLTLVGSEYAVSSRLLAVSALLLAMGGWYLGGGKPVLLHLLLRMILYRRELAPRRFDDFTAAMGRCGIMRRAGNGAFFSHPVYQQYFASLWNSEYDKIYGAVMPAPLPMTRPRPRHKLRQSLEQMPRDTTQMEVDT